MKLLFSFVIKKASNMTSFGKFLLDRAINKAEVSRKTGIRKSRLSQLSNNSKDSLKAEELYLIAKAIDVDASLILDQIFGHLNLTK